MPGSRPRSACFCGAGGALPGARAAPGVARLQRRPRARAARGARCSLLSAAFPVPDPFAVAVPAFSGGLPGLDLRPELVGSLLWAGGLYLGLWGEERWGAASRRALAGALRGAAAGGSNSSISDGGGGGGGGGGVAAAGLLADALHGLPFVLAGFGVDAVLRATAGGNASGAVASGLTVALYAGTAELARLSGRREQSPTERLRAQQFREFAARGLARSGRCHLVDVRAALRRDARCGAAARASDGELRAAIKRFAPQARRSPNGFYRGLSVVDARKARAAPAPGEDSAPR